MDIQTGLWKLYLEKDEFRHKMDQLRGQFEFILETTRDDNHIKDSIVPVMELLYFKKAKCFFFYGSGLKDNNVSNVTLKQGFVNLISLLNSQKYFKIAYFCLDSDFDNFSHFKSLLTCLPIEYQDSLQALYLVCPSFYIKSSIRMNEFWDSDPLKKILASKTQALSALSQLAPALDITIEELLNQTPSRYYDTEYPAFKPLAIRLSGQRQNLTYQQQSNTERQLTNQFRRKVDELVRFSYKPGNKIESFEFSKKGYPIVLEKLLNYFKEDVSRLRFKGIFRMSSLCSEQVALLNSICQMGPKAKFNQYDSYVVANSMKRLFFTLSQPLISFEAFNKLLKDSSPTNIKAVILNLPLQPLITLMVVLDFLVRYAIPEESYSEMGLNNYAIIFAPCLMWTKEPTEAILANTSKSIGIMKNLIIMVDEIFGDAKIRKNIINEINQEQQPFETTQNQQQLSAQAKESRQQFMSEGRDDQYQYLPAPKDNQYWQEPEQKKVTFQSLLQSNLSHKKQTNHQSMKNHKRHEFYHESSNQPNNITILSPPEQMFQANFINDMLNQVQMQQLATTPKQSQAGGQFTQQIQYSPQIKQQNALVELQEGLHNNGNPKPQGQGKRKRASRLLKKYLDN